MRRLLGVVIALAGVALTGVAVLIHASWSGFGYAAGVLVLGVGLAASSAPARRRTAAALGLAIVLGTALVHAEGARGRVTLLSGPSGSASPGVLGRVIDEGDAAVFAANALVESRKLSDPEIKELPRAMRDAYRRMREADGEVPSPVFSSYASPPTPDAFDVLVIEGPPAPRGALVFLHGFGGNFALPCWVVARAAREAGLVTFCPSTGPMGDWWSKAGEETVRRTVALVRARGLDRIYLAGLSSGGIGASRLAPRMRGVFRGVVLVSGAAPDAASAGVPALVVHGARDAMCPAADARRYATRTGARYVEAKGAHFGLLTHEEEYVRAISDWLVASVRRP